MADTVAPEAPEAPERATTPAPATGPGHVAQGAERAPEERGSLELKTKALAHLAQHAATEVSGTVRSGNAVRRTLGRDYPRASARMDGLQASIELDVAVRWPAPVADIAGRTRDLVLQRTRDLAGIDIRRVDVTVHVVTDDESTTDTRRVQ
ncbi:Asp23/Gls24 family envelope stress response protein [Nocardioides sp. CFH 31398]|uniref:Asp23/Gls24 family envelope stress response protein n=1 Tax=Nocardioides sp. CFH 31398 TaxID=2919579 RepID=UPI001F05CC1B|nr:Asp23/Gls24 family envelope stress response protein [Nocardioides sp. CFH 31398]MCH1866914.1 Asp23/Gls24 family envelope stress response protein [Nocardioides sp. CFH 31398]